MKGNIIQINIKNRSKDGIGLPKVPIDSVSVTKMGLEGDYNNYRMKSRRGSLNQAVLIMTKEKLDEISQDGWPIKAGDLGENFLIQGMNYDGIKIGAKFKLGTSLTIEISERCNPCKVLSNLPYVGEETIKQFIRTLAKRRGWYAKVVQEGTVVKGDKIEKVT